MKIFYAVQATGNGHISRAYQLMPYLEEYGEVDVFLSGSNSNLNVPLPIKYRSSGISLNYSECGGLDIQKTWKDMKLLNAMKLARQLPVEQYDVIINDFESITAQACRIKNVPSIQFGHQASFQSSLTPRPSSKNILGEMILKYYAKSAHYIGLHFDAYDDFIFPPVIKQEIQDAEVVDKGHITVYLPAYQKFCLVHFFKKLKHLEFEWFLPEIKEPYRENNIHYFPIDNQTFNKSLISCHGLITGGGFETPAEALFLKKKLMSIPISKHYEQQCNAAALSKLKVHVLTEPGKYFDLEIINWLNQTHELPKIQANNIEKTLEKLFALAKHQKHANLVEELALSN